MEGSKDKAGFAQLIPPGGAHSLFGLAATGPYYLALAYSLHEQGGQVAVLQPLLIRRFLQRPFGKRKTDRKEAHGLWR